MGRLLRKKTSNRTKTKKKKQSADTATSLQVKSIPAVKNKSVSTSSDKNTEKKQISFQKKTIGGTKPAQVKQEKNYWNKGMQFLREVQVELKKVTWPSRKQTIGSTVVVIILVMIISLFLGAVDISLSSLIRLVLQ